MAKSLGLIEFCLRTPKEVPHIMVLMDIVSVKVPALLGICTMDAEGLYADNTTNRLARRKVYTRSNETLDFDDVWSMPIVRRDGHLYSEMSFPITACYTSNQILNLHRQFAHPSAERLYNLQRRAGFQAIASETFERLKEIAANFDLCQRIRHGPLRFPVSIGHEDVRFNAPAYIDIMYLDRKQVLPTFFGR